MARGRIFVNLLFLLASAAIGESSAATKEELESVDLATRVWMDTVTSGAPDAPEKTTDLYADDAVLWGTVSEELRNTRGEILSYFQYFARLPGLRVLEGSYEPTIRLVSPDVAVSSGFYTFEFSKGGVPTAVPARFTFVYRRLPSPTDQGVSWAIVDHHSSKMPEQPSEIPRRAALITQGSDNDTTVSCTTGTCEANQVPSRWASRLLSLSSMLHAPVHVVLTDAVLSLVGNPHPHIALRFPTHRLDFEEF